MLIFPGVGLRSVAVGARWLPDETFAAATRALSECGLPGSRAGAPIFPPLGRLRGVSRTVANAVAHTLVEMEAAPLLSDAEIDRRIAESVREPIYRPHRPAGSSGSGAPEPMVAASELRCRA